MGREAESRRLFTLCLMLAAVLFSSCAARRLPPPAPQPAQPVSLPTVTASVPAASPASDKVAYRETGIASWYGRELQGKRTASGEVFDMEALTAAHRTLPLGTVIRVTNLDNFKSLTLRINDRGPFIAGRVLEVSYAAARDLGFAARGTARVKIEALDRVPDKGVFTVQAALFTEEENAQALKDRLSRRFEVVVVSTFETNAGKLYRVRVGSYQTEEKAEVISGKLKLEGLEPFVLRKD